LFVHDRLKDDQTIIKVRSVQLPSSYKGKTGSEHISSYSWIYSLSPKYNTGCPKKLIAASIQLSGR